MKAYLVDENGNYDILWYCGYFAQKIQTKLPTPEGSFVYDGLSLVDFGKRFDIEELNKMLADEELSKLQHELEKKSEDDVKSVGINLDMANFYMLCQFINAIVRERYFILLKPTIKDTLAELNEVSGISFTCKDGTKATTNNTKLVKATLDAIKANIDSDSCEYESYKLVKIEDFADNIIMQSKFAYWVATFLREYFPEAHRRSNCCMVSAPEQRLILRMLSHCGLAPEGITLSEARFRQLIGFVHKLKMEESYMKLPDMDWLPATFVKYEDWHRKNIDWTSPNLKLHPIEKGETVRITDL